MSVRNKSIAFLAITFAISWGVIFTGWSLGVRDGSGAASILFLSMTGPAIAALICAFAFEPAGSRRAALGLKWTPNLWWLIAWAGMIALAALSVLLTVLLSGQHYVPAGENVRAALTAEGQDISAAPAFMYSTEGLLLLAALVAAPVNFVLLTITEELGWRGYLHHLWRPASFWSASIRTGAVWGAWHGPAILLFGLNYPENPELGVFLFVFYCVLLSAIMTFLRDRGRSVIAAGIAHGTLNSIASLTLASLSAPAFPWNGIVGIGGFLALALAVAGVWRLQQSKAAAPAG